MKWFQFILFEYSIDNSILPLKQSLISTNDLLIPTQWIDNLIRQRLSIIFEIEKLPKEYNPHNMAHKNETHLPLTACTCRAFTARLRPIALYMYMVRYCTVSRPCRVQGQPVLFWTSSESCIFTEVIASGDSQQTKNQNEKNKRKIKKKIKKEF